jgi:SAM-dependent methyltransferase
MNRWLRWLGRRFLPRSTRRKIVRLTRWPPVGRVRFGSLRRLKPVSTAWGTDRGWPVDRYYIERFLARHSRDIQGRVLEIGGNDYTMQFGSDRVTQSDVLHVAEDRPQVTIIGDLTNAAHIASDSFDCIILTQTLQAIYDVRAVIGTVHRILKPGGVVLLTVPGISQISRYDMDRWGYYWSFTTASVRCLLQEAFPPANVQVTAHGNVLASIAFLHGLAQSELKQEELDYVDPDYQLLITARAVKESQR